MSFPAIVYALLVGIIPSLIWLAFWLREDIDHPEPRWLISSCFVAGVFGVIIAIVVEKYVADTFFDHTTRYILWAAVEEIVKFCIIAILALRTSFYDEPIDAMIYMITIALGFSAIENALFIIQPLSDGQIAQSVATESMRFIGASLVHVVSSALIGFCIGFAFYRSKITKAISLFCGLILAITLHSLFNLSIISSTPIGTVKIFMWIWVSVVILMLLFEEIKGINFKNKPLITKYGK